MHNSVFQVLIPFFRVPGNKANAWSVAYVRLVVAIATSNLKTRICMCS